MTTATQTQLRRDTAANLAVATPAAGELGYDTTNKRVVVGDGTTAGGIKLPNAKDIQNQNFIAGAVGGTGDVITLTNTPPSTAYASPQKFTLKATAANTTAVTVNVDGLGAKNVKKMISGVLTALVAGDIVSGGIYDLYYDGTQFQVKGLDETVASAGSMVLLSTQTASASASLDFTSVLSSTYSSYLFVLEDIRPASSAETLYFRTSTNNGSSYDVGGSDYGWAYTSFNGITPANAGVTDASQIELAELLSNTALGALSGDVRLLNSNSATANKNVVYALVAQNSSGHNASYNGFGTRKSATAVNAARFIMSSGNITSGKIRCYGLKAT